MFITPYMIVGCMFGLKSCDLRLMDDPDFGLTVPELIVSRGFECEEHFVRTTDGYILGIHRVVNPTFEGHRLKVDFD